MQWLEKALPMMEPDDVRHVAICHHAGMCENEVLGLKWHHIGEKIHVYLQCRVNSKSIAFFDFAIASWKAND